MLNPNSTKRIFLASNNKDKHKEIMQILSTIDRNIEILTPKDIGLNHIDPEETGETYEENAIIKARAFSEYVDMPIIADDSGLEVSFLTGMPGVQSKRFLGEDKTDSQRNKEILKLMNNIEDPYRTAKFVSALAVILPNNQLTLHRGELYGKISKEELGENGFAYDRIFIPDIHFKNEHRTLAELDIDVKNTISHRVKAIESVRVELFKYFKEDNTTIERQININWKE